MTDSAFERRTQLAALIREAFSGGQFDVSAHKRAFGDDARIEPGQ